MPAVLLRFLFGPSALFGLLALLLVAAGSVPALAQPQVSMPAVPVSLELEEPGASAWVRTDQTAVRLIAARGTVGAEETVRLGLEFALEPGWKVYWRSPGDAGYPPTIDWAGSENLAGPATFAWPVPHRFELFGLQSAGYDDHVVLPLTAQVVDPAQPLHLRAAVDYLICADICIPGDADFSLVLPAGPGGPTQFAHIIEQFQARVPSPGHGVAIDAVERLDARTLRVTLSADPPLRAPDVFVEGPLPHEGGRGLIGAAPQVRLSEGGLRAVATVPLLDPLAEGVAVTLTVADGTRGVETAAVIPVPATAGSGSGAPLGLLTVLGLAVLGGFILNLMPCVLPVLSLKVMGFITHGGAARGEVRAAFLASAAGIVAAFLVLAVVLIALKLGGAAVGWGIQFQQPLFLIAMIALLTLFAANLWGLFEVPLPSWLAGAGGSLGAPRTLAGHFSAGAFATLLATPCSAPFLGTAVGFALARGPGEIALIFAALGVGMALPYLLIAAAPGLARRLPRPGAWMIWLRRVLGFALAGTAVWLLSVLMATVGAEGSLLVAGLMTAVVAALALRRAAAERLRPVASLAVIALVAGAFAVPLAERPSVASVGAPDGLWQPWSPEAVTAEVAAGRVVLVDVTADWCITCRVNKAAVLDRGAVLDALRGPDVTPLVADWTRPNAQIAAYLESFGRYGIPFNVVYGPAAPQGIPLPELLSTDVVLDALARAAGRPAT